MPAGRKRDRIEIQRIKANANTDAYGQIDLDDDANWETYCERKAFKADRGGREFYRGSTIQAEITTQFTIWRDSQAKGITSKMRVKLGTQIWQIVSVTEADNKNRELMLMCKGAIDGI